LLCHQREQNQKLLVSRSTLTWLVRSPWSRAAHAGLAPRRHSTIDANLTATFLTLKSFLPGMSDRRRGSIITMASLAARLPTPASAAYAAAKAGVIMLSRQVADEVGKYGVRVNCVSPSTILTEQIEQYLSPERQQQMTAQHPLGRLGRPEDVALTTLFLASESSGWLTGLTVDVAGGRIMS